MTGIASYESSYMQFSNETLYGVTDKWPYESIKDGGSHIGLMMVQTDANLDYAWNWLTNTQGGVNLFVNSKLVYSHTYVNRIISQQAALGITLRDLTPTEHENNALVNYGPYASTTQLYYTLNSQGTDWIKNTAGNPLGVTYADDVQDDMQ